jgi:hypothetical protein
MATGRPIAPLAPMSEQVRPPLEEGDPTEGWAVLDFPPGTAAAWVDEDRSE